MISPSNFGRRVVALWRTVHAREVAVAILREREAITPSTRWQARQCRELRRSIAKLQARADRQARKLAGA
jgi:hypothetical protein